MSDQNLVMLGVIATFLLAACGQQTPQTPAENQAAPDEPAVAPTAEPLDYAALLANRSESDRARDGGRKPAEVLAVLGIEPGMDVLDLVAAGGWYTAVLSAIVGEEGSVAAQNPGWMHGFRDGAISAGLDTRIEGGLSNVSKLNNEWADLSMMEPLFDVALSALNVHDVYFFEGPEGAAQFATAVYNVLRPGGVFGLIEHVGNADGDNEALHRLPRALTIEIVAAAGFELEEDSDILANPDDDGTLSVFDDSVRGNTDRFLLKFRKPATKQVE